MGYPSQEIFTWKFNFGMGRAIGFAAFCPDR